MRVIIAGCGDIGYDAAKSLIGKKKNELVVIDVDEERCEQLSEELDALVIHGDASDPEVLKKGQIDKADALVAATGSDAINTVIAMLASRQGVDKILVKLNSYGLRSACQEIGVSRIIAPKISTAAEIVSALYNLDRVNFSVLSAGGLVLMEIGVSQDAEKSLSDLDLPENVHVVSVLRGDQMLLPRDSLKMESGDALLLLAEEDVDQESIKERLAPKKEADE